MIIFTDSACDLPKQYLEENNVQFFSLRVEVDGKDYLDIREITPQDVLKVLEDKKQPKTSQVSPDEFLTAFEEAAKNGEEAIYIAFSSELSGTFSTATMIANQVKETYPEFKLHILDTKGAGLGQGLTVKEAIRLRDAGESLDVIFEKASKYAASMEHLFTVDDLEHLARGGRVSKTSAVVGGLLNIKPILNIEEGKLVPIDKVRGRKRAFKTILDLIEERSTNDFSNSVIGICHNNEELLEEVKALVQARFSPKQIETTWIGAVIGSHVGTDVIGMFFLNKGYFE